jgi:preprotein translocase subunit SecD
LTALAVFLLALCRLSVGDAPTTQPASHHLRFSLVADANDSGASDLLDDPNNKGQLIKVLRDSILDESALQDVRKADDANGPGVSLTLTESAGHKFLAFTQAHLHRSLVIVLDDKAICRATIQSGIGKGVQISMQPTNTDKDADAIVTAIASAMKNATTEPAGTGR